MLLQANFILIFKKYHLFSSFYCPIKFRKVFLKNLSSKISIHERCSVNQRKQCWNHYEAIKRVLKKGVVKTETILEKQVTENDTNLFPLLGHHFSQSKAFIVFNKLLFLDSRGERSLLNPTNNIIYSC